MEIEQNIKEQVKARHIKELKIRYYTEKLNQVACEAIGDQEGAKIAQEKMEKIQKAYDAINAL